ncbi:MAG: hypothetical protein DHS20C18_12570 [Saprospiraceae bacterium]|nr:MAG: hypothetical protein DHS20C18_12570 [Saprospiraceae bacterium]
MVVVQNSLTGTTFHDLNMNNDRQGSLSLTVTPDDTTLYFIIACMPEVFEDSNPSFQLFPYEMRIRLGNPTAVLEVDSQEERSVIGRYNLLGQKVSENSGGFQLILYDDGTTTMIYSR